MIFLEAPFDDVSKPGIFVYNFQTGVIFVFRFNVFQRSDSNRIEIMLNCIPFFDFLIWCDTCRKLKQYNSEGPDVYLEITSALNLFRRHISPCTRISLVFLDISIHFLSNTKVNNLCRFEIVIYKYIWRLQILMNNLALMQIPQSRNELRPYSFNDLNILSRPLLNDLFFHVTAFDSLHDNMKYVFSFFGEVLFHKIMVFYDIRMLQVLANLELGIHSPKLNFV